MLDSEEIPKSWNVNDKPFLGVPFTAKEAVAIQGMTYQLDHIVVNLLHDKRFVFR